MDAASTPPRWFGPVRAGIRSQEATPAWSLTITVLIDNEEKVR